MPFCIKFFHCFGSTLYKGLESSQGPRQACDVPTSAEETPARGSLGKDSADCGARLVRASSLGRWSSQALRERTLYRVTAEFTLHSGGYNVPSFGTIIIIIVLLVYVY